MPAHFPALQITLFTHRRGARSQPVSDDDCGRAVTLHGLLDEPQSRAFVALPGDVAFEDLAFVIDRMPELHHLTVQFDAHLVELPTPLPKALHSADLLPPDVGGEHRAELVPPMSDRLMAYVDPALKQQVFLVP